MSERQKFFLDDVVEWESQSHGYHKTKLGHVVRIVPAGERPGWLNDGRYGLPRDHESYVVRVRNRYYWPLVRHLHPAPSEPTEKEKD